MDADVLDDPYMQPQEKPDPLAKLRADLLRAGVRFAGHDYEPQADQIRRRRLSAQKALMFPGASSSYVDTYRD